MCNKCDYKNMKYLEDFEEFYLHRGDDGIWTMHCNGYHESFMVDVYFCPNCGQKLE